MKWKQESFIAKNAERGTFSLTANGSTKGPMNNAKTRITTAWKIKKGGA